MIKKQAQREKNGLRVFPTEKKIGKIMVKATEKECPYCKTKINIHATRCPHCTSVLEDQ